MAGTCYHILRPSSSDINTLNLVGAPHAMRPLFCHQIDSKSVATCFTGPMPFRRKIFMLQAEASGRETIVPE